MKKALVQKCLSKRFTLVLPRFLEIVATTQKVQPEISENSMNSENPLKTLNKMRSRFILSASHCIYFNIIIILFCSWITTNCHLNLKLLLLLLSFRVPLDLNDNLKKKGFYLRGIIRNKQPKQIKEKLVMKKINNINWKIVWLIKSKKKERIRGRNEIKVKGPDE